MAFFCTLYLLATEYVLLQKSKGEVLLFPKGTVRKSQKAEDEEAQDVISQNTPMVASPDGFLQSHQVGLDEKAQPATFVWENLSYEILGKKGKKRILENVEGWIKPRTLTALIVTLPS
jgi:hypothetical protein